MSVVFKLETFAFLIFAKVSKPKTVQEGLYSRSTAPATSSPSVGLIERIRRFLRRDIP